MHLKSRSAGRFHLSSPPSLATDLNRRGGVEVESETDPAEKGAVTSVRSGSKGFSRKLANSRVGLKQDVHEQSSAISRFLAAPNRRCENQLDGRQLDRALA